MPNAWDNVFGATFPVDPATGHRIADAVVALGETLLMCGCGRWRIPGVGVDPYCHGLMRRGLWIPDDPEEGPA